MEMPLSLPSSLPLLPCLARGSISLKQGLFWFPAWLDWCWSNVFTLLLLSLVSVPDQTSHDPQTREVSKNSYFSLVSF